MEKGMLLMGLVASFLLLVFLISAMVLVRGKQAQRQALREMLGLPDEDDEGGRGANRRGRG